MKILLSLILSSCFLITCSTKPQPINYGHVSCDYCKMTVVDQKYAAQLITTKGKTFVFDATECLINYKNAEENKRHKYSQILVTNYVQPTVLIDAQLATYLRSSALPSPMGVHITAIGTLEEANQLKEKHVGLLYSWKELNEGFNNLPSLNHFHQ